MEKILVVDDDQLILQALSRIVRSEGYEVIAHSDPIEALKERGFSVVVSDFNMPGMNGIELLGELKRSNPDSVRMLLTAAADFKVALEAVNRSEVFRILSKPWTLGELSMSLKQSVDHFRLRQENQRLSRELAERNADLTTMNLHLEKMVVDRTNGLLNGMVSALDYRDTETQWHSRRVSLYSRRIAESAGVQGSILDVIEQGALLHDIGKIGVRDSILLKPGPLTPEEWVEMKLHPEIGHRMLSKIPYLHDASLIVLQHQERWDGAGYPAGLAGPEIVIGARVFAIADTIDAITSDRPYRKGRPLEVAKAELVRCSGTQFDPDLVRAFLAVDDREWLGIRESIEQIEREESQRWPSRSSPAALRMRGTGTPTGAALTGTT